jgi:hypothetical protein
MPARSLIVSAMGLTLSAAVLTGPVRAGNTFTIAVPDPTVNLKESFTVNGSNTPCANGAYTVTFSYTNHDGNPATSQASGTTDANNQFSQPMTVPEAATPDQPASVQATVDCSSPTPSPSSSAGAAPLSRNRVVPQQVPSGTSNTVAITIEVASGVLSTDKTSGRAGTVVHVSGTNCLGDDVIAVFGNNSGADNVPVVLLPDDTFSGDYTIPNVPAGSYFFAAACPGTDYEDRAFTVLATPGLSPSPLPSTTPNPITGPVNFTG